MSDKTDIRRRAPLIFLLCFASGGGMVALLSRAILEGEVYIGRGEFLQFHQHPIISVILIILFAFFLFCCVYCAFLLIRELLKE